MEINGIGDGRWNSYSSSVYGLPSIISVHATRDLLDKYRSKTFAANLFMDTEKIHLILTLQRHLLPQPWKLRFYVHEFSEALLK